MDYEQARTVFLSPPAAERPAPRAPDTPARRLRDAAEPIATIYIWGRPVNERLAGLGLNFLTGYLWSRTAPMGEPTAPVVVSAFAVFEPGLISGLWDEARRIASREQVLAVREEGSVASLRELLPDADVLPPEDLQRSIADGMLPDAVVIDGTQLMELPARHRRIILSLPRVLVCTGMLLASMPTKIVARPNVAVLAKPFCVDDLEAAIEWLRGAPPAVAGTASPLAAMLSRPRQRRPRVAQPLA